MGRLTEGRAGNKMIPRHRPLVDWEGSFLFNFLRFGTTTDTARLALDSGFFQFGEKGTFFLYSSCG